MNWPTITIEGKGGKKYTFPVSPKALEVMGMDFLILMGFARWYFQPEFKMSGTIKEFEKYEKEHNHFRKFENDCYTELKKPGHILKAPVPSHGGFVPNAPDTP